MSNAYHFVSRWRVKASTVEVYDIISQPLEYPRWWPAVYLKARETTLPKISPIGRSVEFHTKGMLPYTLIWHATVAETTPPERIVLNASGDFEGRGVWSFAQDDDFVNVTFEWNIEVTKPMLRYMTPFLRPVVDANHRWSMEQGEASLREELIRYRARTPEDLMEAADPRGPVEVPVRLLAVSALAVTALAGIALMKRKSRKIESAS